MTELELRKKHNEEAIKAIAAVRMRMYPGMIRSVEADEDCLTGRAIVATTDDIYQYIPKKYQYNPHIMAKNRADGGVEDLGAEEITDPRLSIAPSATTVAARVGDLLAAPSGSVNLEDLL